MFLPVGCSLNQFYAVFQKVASVAIEAAKKIPLPGLKTTPTGINPSAEKKYWKEFCGKYEHIWERYKAEPERAWACCVAIWTNYCLKRKTQPFNAVATAVNEETRDTLIDRLISSREAQLKLVRMLVSKGARKGVFAKVLKESFISAHESKPGVFVLLSHMFVKMEKGVEYNSKPFKELMSLCSFQSKRGAFIRNVRTNTDVIVHMDPDEERPAIVLKNTVTKAFAEIILGIDSSKDNTDKVKSGLIREWKQTIKEVAL